MSAIDEAEFGTLTQRHRRELHVHCYRMLASFDDAEDAVQETMLRAWRGRDSFSGGSLFRAWLYRIATNVCLDKLRRASSPTEVAWLQPYPDQLLDEATSTAQAPEEHAVQRETIELAFLAALQVLPPRQRAALIARDVLGWPAAQTAEALGTSVPAANSALQRARVTMREHLPAERSAWTATAAPSAAEKELLAKFIDAHDRCDTQAAIAIAAQDIRVTMPPFPMCFDGLAAVKGLMARAFGPDREGDWRALPTSANRMPAAACYLLRPGDTAYRAYKLDVLRIRRREGRGGDDVRNAPVRLFRPADVAAGLASAGGEGVGVGLAQQPMPERPVLGPGDDVAAADQACHFHPEQLRHVDTPWRPDLHMAAADRHVVGVYHDAGLGDDDEVAAAHLGFDLEHPLRDDGFREVEDDAARHVQVHPLRDNPAAVAHGVAAAAVDPDDVLGLGRWGARFRPHRGQVGGQRGQLAIGPCVHGQLKPLIQFVGGQPPVARRDPQHLDHLVPVLMRCAQIAGRHLAARLFVSHEQTLSPARALHHAVRGTVREHR